MYHENRPNATGGQEVLDRKKTPAGEAGDKPRNIYYRIERHNRKAPATAKQPGALREYRSSTLNRKIAGVVEGVKENRPGVTRGYPNQGENQERHG